MGQRKNQNGNKTYIEMNLHRNKIYQNLWDVMKAVLWEVYDDKSLH